MKFRLKTTQLKTIFNSYPGGNYPGAIVQGKIALEEFHGGQLSKEELFGDNCPGVKSLGGNYPWGGIVRGRLSKEIVIKTLKSILLNTGFPVKRSLSLYSSATIVYHESFYLKYRVTIMVMTMD